MDIQRFPGVAICADAERLPFAGASLSGVLLRGVLEHVRRADVVRAEVARVLRPGGFFYVEVPFLQPFHESPEDYRRFTLPGLRAFLADFPEAAAGVQIGPFSSLAWVTREAAASLLSFGSPWLYPKVLLVAAWATFSAQVPGSARRTCPTCGHGGERRLLPRAKAWLSRASASSCPLSIGRGSSRRRWTRSRRRRAQPTR